MRRFLILIVLPVAIFCIPNRGMTSDAENEIIEPSTFLSPTRLPQSKRDTPSGLTVITADEIHALGITKLPELMRLVPGMRMIQANGWDYRINYHGTSAFRPRRMSVLIDGNPVFRSAFQQVDWTRIPISINDIARVEIVRSPSSASYGSNAFQAVINIVTNHPVDVPTIKASLEAGSNGLVTNSLQLGGKLGMNSYLLSFNETKDDGFDFTLSDVKKGFERDGNDDIRSQRLHLRTEHLLSDNSRLQFSAGYSNSDLNNMQIESQQTNFGYSNQKDSHFNAEYFYNPNEKNAFTIKAQFNKTDYIQRWPTCFYTAYFIPALRELYEVNPKSALDLFAGKLPVGSTDQERQLISAALGQAQSVASDLRKNICGSGNQDSLEVRENIEFSHTYIASETFKINAGIGYWFNEGESETFYRGKTSSNYRYVFSNGEYSPIDALTFNIGGMYEEISTVNDSAFSPRFGLNVHINDNSTVRAIYSSGRRMPSLDETNRKWSYFMRDWNKTVFGKNEGWFFLTAYSNPNLLPEKIKSYELGIFSEYMNGRINYDVKVFKENLSDLMSEKILYFNYNLTNNSEVELSGLEAEFGFKINSSLALKVGISRLNSDVTNVAEETLYSKYAGFGSAIYKLNDITLGLTYVSNSKIAGQSFDRIDLSISSKINFNTAETFSWRFVVTNNHFDYIPYERNPNDIVLNGYDEEFQYRFGLTMEY